MVKVGWVGGTCGVRDLPGFTYFHHRWLGDVPFDKLMLLYYHSISTVVNIQVKGW